MTGFLAACGGGGTEGGSVAGSSSTEDRATGNSITENSAAGSDQLASSGPSTSLYAHAKEMFEQDGGSTLAAPTGEGQISASVSSFSSDMVLLAPGVDVVTEGPAGQDADAFTLTFYDSFDGELDRSVWHLDGFSGRLNASNAVPNYASGNGSLKIWPQRGSNGEFFDRTLDTRRSFTQQYGYFEIEAKLPKGNGVWPAFWLLSMSGDGRPEIDIMEAYPGGVAPWGTPGADGVPAATMYAPVVWRDAHDQAGYAKVATPDLSDDFHRYGAKWEPNKVTFYFDGEEVYSVDASVSDPMFMILDLWFGSASGQPDSSTPAGDSNAFEINYVKAWQFK